MIARIFRRGAAVVVALTVAACVTNNPYQMVKDPKTGLMYGSYVDRSIMLDPSFVPNRYIKLTIRNTSGDPAFELSGFRERIANGFRGRGWQITEGDDFAVMVGINVMYSGVIQDDSVAEFATLGAAAGGIQGYRSKAEAGTAIGVVSGATLGAVVGSFVTQDTYMIKTAVQIGVRERAKSEGKVITFDRSSKLRDYDDEGYGKWRENRTIRVWTYGGGTMVGQAEIVDQVRERMALIMRDIL